VTVVQGPRSASDDPARDTGWVLSLESVSKDYPPPAPMRVRRLFARFGGLHVEEGFAPDALSGMAEDEEDELTDVEAAEDEEPLPPREEALGRRVVDSVTLQAHGGSLVVVLGPAGAGKTVLLKLIGGLVPPSSGRVVVRGSVAPALNDMALIMPARGHRVGNALPELGAMVGVSPRLVRSRFDRIAELMESPGLRKSSTSLMESRRKRELILAMALSVEPDILLLDIPIPRDAFGDRCMTRLDELRARGTLVVAEMRDLRKTRLEPDRLVALEGGRVRGS
jgi:ABC-type polysaccharide/polyol phosphate transport system ATPase subunit